MTSVPTPSQQQLLDRARSARDSAYAPHSRFPVGAAVLTGSGKIYAGCNVENASFGLSICAERVAIFSAVCAGEREIVDIAVVTDTESPSRPCGACRQVLFEFGRDAVVLMGNLKGSAVVRTLRELFPEPFELDP
jgi:cytidine deaminase